MDKLKSERGTITLFVLPEMPFCLTNNINIVKYGNIRLIEKQLQS